VDIAPPNPNQTDGYLVLLKPEVAFDQWKLEVEGTWSAESVEAYWTPLRNVLPSVRQSRYRGIQRNPIDRWWEGEASVREPKPNERARRHIWNLYGPDPCMHWVQPPWFDADLLPALEVAYKILALTDIPADYEILRVTRDEIAPTSQTLGFDVGYWGSDHFSIIADAMVAPRWHGCPGEQLSSLAPWGRRLNDHMLFPTVADALEYRGWYLTQSWAETEGAAGEFQVIRADVQ
jgi:hypothetical protein